MEFYIDYQEKLNHYQKEYDKDKSNNTVKDLYRKYMDYKKNKIRMDLWSAAETDNIQHMIHQLSLQMMKRFNGNMPRIYGTIQFYRKDSK